MSFRRGFIAAINIAPHLGQAGALKSQASSNPLIVSQIRAC